MVRRLSWYRTTPIALVQLALVGCSAALLTGCPNAGSVNNGAVAGATESQIVLPQPTDGVCNTPGNVEAVVDELLERVNLERTNRGLDPLTLNPKLSEIADDFACAMIADDFFSHVDPDGQGPGQRAINAGYVFLAIGENLAGGQTTPVQVMREWMASTEGHRENILSPQWTEIGISVRTGGEYGVYWVQEFGNPP